MLHQTLYYKTVPSPIGPLKLIASEKGLSAVMFNGGRKNKLSEGTLEQGDNYPLLKQAEQQFKEYFAGERKHFDLPLDIRGSIFQIRAWRELQKIPYGETISYGEQARRIGDVKKARAAGMANGCNPLAIIVPCHRVIGASGDLTGFGGGLETKKFLLDLEKKYNKTAKPEAPEAKKRRRAG